MVAIILTKYIRGVQGTFDYHRLEKQLRAQKKSEHIA
jgi:hypothetical protein